MAKAYTLENGDDWIGSALASGLKTATTETHNFPPALSEVLQQLLEGELQAPLKAAEIEELATRLIAINGGSR